MREASHKLHGSLIIASSSIDQSATRTERAPALRKARAMLTTPSLDTLPWALWQRLNTTSFASNFAACTSEIVNLKSCYSGVSDFRCGFGANAISPVSIFPCAAMCTKATEPILFSTSALVASFALSGWRPSIAPIISTSFLAKGKGKYLFSPSKVVIF